MTPEEKMVWTAAFGSTFARLVTAYVDTDVARQEAVFVAERAVNHFNIARTENYGKDSFISQMK